MQKVPIFLSQYHSHKNNMKNKKIMYKVIITTLITGVCVFGALYLYIHIEKTKETIKVAREEITIARKQEEDIQTLRRTLRTTVEDQARLEDYFITKGESVRFIEAVETVGKESGVELEIKSVIETGEVGVKKLRIEAVISGKYNLVKNAVLRIEHMPYEIFIDSVFFNASIDQTTGTSTGIFDANITFTLLSYNE